jgi:hypothetical protein
VVDHDIDESISNSPVDHKCVRLTGMGLSDGEEVDLLERRVRLTVDINARLVEAEAVVEAVESPEPMLSLLAEMDDVDVKLSHRQYVLIMNLLDGNIWAEQEWRGSEQGVAAVVRYDYDVEDKAVYTTKYVVKLDRVSLTLAGSEDPLMALVEIRQLRLESEQLLEGTVVTDVTLGSVEATDRRSAAVGCLACIGSRADTDAPSPVSSTDASYQSAVVQWAHTNFADGSCETHWTVRDLRVFMVAELVVQIMNFLDRPTQDVHQHSSQQLSNKSNVISTEPLERHGSRAHTHTTKFDAHSFQVILIADAATAAPVRQRRGAGTLFLRLTIPSLPGIQGNIGVIGHGHTVHRTATCASWAF